MMINFIFALMAAVVVFLLYRLVMRKRNADAPEKTLYVCHECGERDCVCHRAVDENEK